jgi:hypothetical protein
MKREVFKLLFFLKIKYNKTMEKIEKKDMDLKKVLEPIFDFIKSYEFDQMDDRSRSLAYNYFSKKLVNDFYSKQIDLTKKDEEILVEVILHLDYFYNKMGGEIKFKDLKDILKIIQ